MKLDMNIGGYQPCRCTQRMAELWNSHRIQVTQLRNIEIKTLIQFRPDADNICEYTPLTKADYIQYYEGYEIIPPYYQTLARLQETKN